ncbi:MAG: hypothetical protein Q4G69_13370 [Planctomycetia bacterium]|nr:hypothetical protein [Planctomycetia bacterium]
MERTSPFILISRFVHNEISEQELDELLAGIENDRKILILLKRNILADLLLKEKFQIEREKGES